MTTQDLVPYPLGEEIANSVIHGIGTALGVAALSILVTLAGVYGDAWRVVSFSIYGTTLILLFLASTLYHSIQHTETKRFFRILDHSAIFLLIAGTYTPFTLVSMRGPWGWSMFGVIWGLALIGIVATLFIHDRGKLFTALIYVAMGWIVIIAFKPLVAALPLGGLIWLALGGVLYTSGVIFYVWKKLPFNHAIWHLFVLAASICHFFAMLFYVLPGG
ncbi:MAG: hemolysin D [Deltaproteobacteria bacterium RIFOXYA12_FULL_61_11]|nr:MAG: hemolysin D [Deltaproteobacteria bacterium RIFOXYA12_FULL_61_11]